MSPTFPPDVGGVESHVYLLSRILLEKGFDIEVFTTKPNANGISHDCVDGIPVTRFPSIAPFDAVFFSHSLTKALQKTKVDLVHAHGFRSLPMLSAAFARRSNRYRFIVTTHLGFSKLGRLPYIIYNPVFGRMIFDAADNILLVSSKERLMLPILNGYLKKVAVIPNGIEMPDGRFEETCELKQTDRLRLLYVGRLEKKKGIDTAIRILQSLPDKRITLDIVGVGEYADCLAALVKRLNLTQRVRLHGRVEPDSLRDLYHRAHILLLLSQWESFGISIIEAMSAGVVPIVTGVGGIPDVVGKKAGFIVDYPVDERTVARLIMGLDADRRTLQDMAREGWKKARQDYDMKAIAPRIGRIYGNV